MGRSERSRAMSERVEWKSQDPDLSVMSSQSEVGTIEWVVDVYNVLVYLRQVSIAEIQGAEIQGIHLFHLSTTSIHSPNFPPIQY